MMDKAEAEKLEQSIQKIHSDTRALTTKVERLISASANERDKYGRTKSETLALLKTRLTPAQRVAFDQQMGEDMGKLQLEVKRETDLILAQQAVDSGIAAKPEGVAPKRLGKLSKRFV
ncbi:MAG: hypothetical protein V4623_06890 [Pseudomonadota bacterium]